MMPSGEYYVGDLCYVMEDDEWDQFCNITIQGNRCLDGEFTMLDGRKFATYGTKWGDGEYRDQYGNRYPVDAGLIGCILLSDIRADKYGDLKRCGAIHKFERDFVTRGGRSSNAQGWDGVIYFGNLAVDTDGSMMYDFDDDEES